MPEKYDLLDLIDIDMQEIVSRIKEEKDETNSISYNSLQEIEFKNKNPLTLKYKKRLEDAIKTYRLNQAAA